MKLATLHALGVTSAVLINGSNLAAKEAQLATSGGRPLAICAGKPLAIDVDTVMKLDSSGRWNHRRVAPVSHYAVFQGCRRVFAELTHATARSGNVFRVWCDEHTDKKTSEMPGDDGLDGGGDAARHTQTALIAYGALVPASRVKAGTTSRRIASTPCIVVRVARRLVGARARATAPRPARR